MTGKTERAHRRARVAVVVGLALLVVSHAALAVGLERLVPELRDPEYGLRLRSAKRLHREHPERPLVVAIGTSRTEMGLSPADLNLGPVAWPGRPTAEPLVVNFGSSGAGPLHQQLLLRRIREDGLCPDAVLLEILPAMLRAGDDLGPLLRPSEMTLPEIHLARPYCAKPGKLREEWWRARLSPWFSTRLTLVSRVAPTLLPWNLRRTYLWENTDCYGWLGLPQTDVSDEHRRFGQERVRSQYGPCLADFTVTPTPDHVLRRTLDYCRARGIRVALHLMPESPFYRQMYTPEGLARLEAYLVAISREYNVPVLDARTWLAEEEFLDSHHILRANARRFSARFGRELLGPWLRGEPLPPFPGK